MPVRSFVMINSGRPYAMMLSACALAALLFAVPFAFGVDAIAPLTLTGVPLIVLVAIIGVADQFLDLRRRTGLVRPDQEA
ncbi:MAG: hypothetical protein CL566_06355 [Alphaproteobacteria bacterium]|nr:hypothetical protein [Alphaproteobacteria bacterium]